GDQDITLLDDSLLQQAVPLDLLKSTRKLMTRKAANLEYAIDMNRVKANLKRVYDAGVRLVTGTDAGNPLVFHGPTIQQELELWVAAGIPADRALIAATRTSAELLGQGSRIGTIEIGKDANLLLVDGDPVKDVKSLSRISAVLLKGERISRNSLLKDENE
ncbi:MAG: amidohydrolase family protein, partial [Acidobacteria bacterium]|nr:amidohydrolase family protein [Acidobacteriota bacterium]